MKKFIVFFICLFIISCEDKKSDNDTEVEVSYLDNGWLQYETSLGVTVDAYYNHPNQGTKVSGIIYHHGKKVEDVGYDSAKALGYNVIDFPEALAANGFAGLAPLRQPISSHDDGLFDGALDLLLSSDDVDEDKAALIGFSRGGLLSLHYVLDNPNAVDVVVLMSPSPGGGNLTFDDALEKLDNLAIPLLVTVGEKDNDPIIPQVQTLINKLTELNKTFVAITGITDGSDDGGTHEWFYQVRDDYWPDIISFLNTHL